MWSLYYAKMSLKPIDFKGLYMRLVTYQDLQSEGNVNTVGCLHAYVWDVFEECEPQASERLNMADSRVRVFRA